jgi:hypothetical protein
MRLFNFKNVNVFIPEEVFDAAMKVNPAFGRANPFPLESIIIPDKAGIEALVKIVEDPNNASVKYLIEVERSASLANNHYHQNVLDNKDYQAYL